MSGSNPPTGTNGDREAQLQVLLLRSYSRLLGYVERHLPSTFRSTIDPQDVIQDVYFEAFRHLHQFEPDSPNGAIRWLTTIARHQIAHQLRMSRAAKRGGGYATSVQPDSAVMALEALAVYRRTPSQSAMAREMFKRVEQAIDNLPEPLRQALILRYVEQLSPADIARRLDRTERAVHQLCYRGLELLRQQMRSDSNIA